MKKFIIFFTIIFAWGCDDLVDFTEIENPNLSEASVVGQPNSSTIWLSGIERQLALVLNEIIINAEIASDNYDNTQTFFNQFLDGLGITPQDDDLADMQFAFHRLREMATFGLSSVGPGDPNYTSETQAEYNYFEGISYLFAGMYFVALPVEAGGAALTSVENYNRAVQAFDQAISLNNLPEYNLAKARALYYSGDKAGAVSAANAALSVGGNDFLRIARFDEVEDPDNTMEDGLYERGTFDDLQPLPTLDFLDPKYSFNTAAEDDPVNYLKAEEALLILTEAAIADGDLDGAKGFMRTLLATVAGRPLKMVDDSIEGRNELEPGSRPNTSCVEVNGRMGLVVDRDQGMIPVPTVSGTSLTEEEIDGLSNADDALKVLYRTRQEIFIAEGIRMVDMGVKLVVSETEQLQNENIAAGGSESTPQIPPFIDAVKLELDAIQFNPGSCEASTVIDVNEILVNNKSSNLVVPFQ